MDRDGLRAAFGKRFGGEPTHLVQAPGRVELMGEQLAVHGLPVLSLALPRGIRLALRPRDDEAVRIQDLGPGGGEISFEVGVAQESARDGDAAGEMREVARTLARRFAVWRGFDGVLHSDLPAPPALGADVALRVAAGLALAGLGEVGAEPAELARVLGGREGEASVAHAVCLGAQPGHALAVKQGPTHLRAIMLPTDWRVVVARAGSPRTGPGWSPAWGAQRRAECREALERLEAHLVSAGRMRAATGSWSAVFRALGGPARALVPGEEALDGSLLKRFRHLASEADRTRTAEDALLLADLHELGALMDQCHGSLRGDFLVSSAALDQTAAAALEGGAAGAHLTGEAGWVVALADVGTVHAVLEALRAQVADPRSVFVAQAVGGASLVPF